MEEALEILWTYARREAIDCNGKVVIPTINQSIAAIRLIIRLEGARKNNEKKVKSKASENLELGMWVNSKASENLALGHRREERKVMKEERRVINVADYTSFEEEEEEEDDEEESEDEPEGSSAFVALVPLDTMRVVGSVREVESTADTVTLPSMVS